MNKVLLLATGGLLTAASLIGCSSSDGGDEEPVPVGGINGPAQVDPDSGSAENDGSDG